MVAKRHRLWLALLLALAVPAFAQTLTSKGWEMLVKAAEAIYDSFEGPGKDVFDRFRVSNPFTVFDSKEVSRSNPNLWDEVTVGGGSIAFNTNQASHTLSVGTASGDKATRQTLQRMIYEPGHGQLVLINRGGR